MIGRRTFLEKCGAGIAGLGTLSRSVAGGSPGNGRLPDKLLVTIFLRGGLDGLNTVVPFADPSYGSLRPHIGVPAPSRRRPSAIDLDGFFGLHPSLADLLPVYRKGHLAFVHAVGSAKVLPSHFQAQRCIGTALIDAAEPRLVGGPRLENLLPERPGIPFPPGQFGQRLRHLARLVKAGSGGGMVTLDFSGWDHHVDEGGIEGRLACSLKQLGEGLATFYTELAESQPNVLVLAISEFGRATRENRNGGTDHGHGGVAILMGVTVQGGRVYGEWPGLDQGTLSATTDIRQILSECRQKFFGRSGLPGVFPEDPVDRDQLLGLL